MFVAPDRRTSSYAQNSSLVIGIWLERFLSERFGVRILEFDGE
jgi:hypothetical protein